MKRARALAALSVPALLAAILTAIPAAGADDSDAGAQAVARKATLAKLTARSGKGQSYVPPARASHRPAPRAATMTVTYHGFSRAARRAFQRAVDTWEPLITSGVPITVDATFEPAANPNNLGSAGPSFIWRDFQGAPKASTWYVDAIANKRRGQQMDPAPDVVANFNSNRTDWYFGADGMPPNGRYDFQSVVLHEIGHGLGFLGLAGVSGGQGSIRFDNRLSSYDRFTENGAGTKLSTFADPSSQLATQLQGNSVFFDSPKVRNANGGNTARLFAPNPFQPGSSYSHLNESTYPAGNVNSLMTPFLNDAEGIHDPGPITNALFRSIGW